MFLASKKLKIFLRTIFDIGIVRLFLRIIHEIQKFLDTLLPSNILEFLTPYFYKIPKWKNSNNYENYPLLNFNLNSFSNNKKVIFNFLNERKILQVPIEWNNDNWSKLWRFNLHYFDWSRDWLDDYLGSKRTKNDIYLIKDLIDDWIYFNELGKGDGWHSYPTSLRIKNWVYIFRIFPNLISQNRLDSLWRQICWLNTHKEYAFGGNHLIENLTALIIGCLQFESNASKNIYRKSIIVLRNELEKQILKDGGHEERSASYHILILDRLVEMSFYIEIYLGENPKWLIKKIEEMTIWLTKIELMNGLYPRFNDCTFNSKYSLEKIKNFSLSFLGDKKYSLEGFREFLNKSNTKVKKFRKITSNSELIKPLIDLPETGWTIIKPNGDWELIFKCGNSCPKHLPAHCHSDLLSFDLYHRGKPFFSEYGTSIYGKNKIREIERSSAAHNIFQLSKPIKTSMSQDLFWIEPVEVWDNFRAGRKAKTQNRSFGKNKNSEYWVQGSHDGYESNGAVYKRKLKLKVLDEQLNLNIEDTVKNSKKMAWRQFWHLGPNIDDKYFNEIISQLREKHDFEFEIKETWYSKDFGYRIPRKSLILNGFLEPGYHSFKITLLLK